MTNKSTYTGHNFIFHILESNNETTISLSSDYVNPPVEKHELVQLCDFIKKYLESTNALERN